MARMSGGLEVVGNPDPRELQIFALLFAAKLLRAFGVVTVVPLGRLTGFHLRFHVFAFPSSRHTRSLTHFAAGRVFMREKVRGGIQALAARLRGKTGSGVCICTTLTRVVCATRARCSAK